MAVIDEARTTLQFRRVFNAPPAAVFAAWTQPEQMKKWFCPDDAWGDAEVSSDLRIGGRFRVVMRVPDGEVHRVGGVFQEIVAPRKLKYTWAWESTPERESLVTVEFRDAPGQAGATELLLTHQRFADEQARDGHQQGWNGSIAHLERFLQNVSD